jgi:thiol-disulfide isomerase/thioredoxin
MKYIVTKLSASWCAPCRFYAETFHKVSEREEFKNIEFKALDIDSDEEAEALVNKFSVRGVPTTLIMNEDGELIYKLTGNVKESDLVDAINNAINK